MLLFVTDKKLFKKDFKPQLFVALKQIDFILHK